MIFNTKKKFLKKTKTLKTLKKTKTYKKKKMMKNLIKKKLKILQKNTLITLKNIKSTCKK